MQGTRYYVPGIMLILAAILIIAVPEILIALIAGLLLIFGIGALVLGHMIRKSNLEMGSLNRPYYGDFLHDRYIAGTPLFRWMR